MLSFETGSTAFASPVMFLIQQQDRLLNMRLSDNIDQELFAAKHTQMRAPLASIKLQLDVLALKVLQLTRGVDNFLNRSPPEPEEVRFRNRLFRRKDHLLGCLQDPAAEPTNTVPSGIRGRR